MDKHDNAVSFTLGYEALALLGKGMYSNLWAALSELIANGIDANPSFVKIYINMVDKTNSEIEIVDNGSGMTPEDIRDKYVVIGNNKREGDTENAESLMGRKGVGKLAALFLTSKYDISTKVDGESESTWRFDFDDRSTAAPALHPIKREEYTLGEIFDKETSGTLVKLYNVNLENMAEEAINALRYIMANYFIYDNLPNVSVEFYINDGSKSLDACLATPLSMKKQVAWNNMLAIAGDDISLGLVDDAVVKMPLDKPGYFEKNDMDFESERFSFASVCDYANGVYKTTRLGEELSIPYKLTGWIGIHASINQKEAQKNDNSFVKNKYYNPNKLRLYIRNKLAVEDFTSYLKNTQQGINYIEGEISFDLLDDNSLDDITTSNRQDVDIHDKRVSLLIDVVKKIVNRLISERNTVTAAVGEENKKRKEIIESRAKVKAKKAIKQDLDNIGVDQEKVDDIVASFDSKLRGDNNLKAKEIYKLFISHARKDRRFSDFIYNLLIKKGALPEEVFYTTRQVQGNSTLSQDIKRNIMENNTIVLFLDSANFMRSSYCLFEGGAFWATRSMDSCIHIHFDTAWIPDYINDHEKYHVPLHRGKVLTPSIFDLTQSKYNELVQVLNIIIEHLNSSALHNGHEISLLEEVAFPPEIEMERNGQVPKDFMDPDFVDYWNFYVVEGKTDITQDGNVVDCDAYISEYNKNVEKLS